MDRQLQVSYESCRISTISKYLRITGRVAMLGLDGRQWLACTIICAMIGLFVTVPTGVVVRAANSEGLGFEPVNEELSVWTASWRNLKAELEARMTPWRPTNLAASFFAGSDDDKKKKNLPSEHRPPIDITKDNSPTDSSTNRSSISGTNAEPVTNNGVPVTRSNAVPAKRAAAMFSELPPDERGSIYTYQNNLGSPRGQVEMDSTNEAAALNIKHRVGIGNFNFALPLASLGGRGIDASVGLTYNSRTWNKSYTGVNDHYTYDVEQSWIAPGFSSGFGYLSSRMNTQTYYTNGHPHNIYEVQAEGLTDADGTRHPINCKAADWVPGTNHAATYCTEFGTTDGTAIRIIRDGTAYGDDTYPVNHSTIRFDVYYPNGSKTKFDYPFETSGTIRRHPAQTLRDRNGNLFTIGYNADHSGRIDYINDTLNRRIRFYYENIGGVPDKLVAVTIPGMGTNEELQSVRFYYDTLTLNVSGKFTGTVTAPTTPIKILRWVYFPMTKTGYKYDYSTEFGMIKKITRYVGVTATTTLLTQTGAINETGPNAPLFSASTEYNYPTGSPPLSDVPKYTMRTDDWQGRTSESPQQTEYNSPDFVPGQDNVSTITVHDTGFDVDTASTIDGSGMLKETSITKRWNQFQQLIQKAKYTWSEDRDLTRLEVTNDSGLIKATTFDYDSHHNQTRMRECGYAAANATCDDTTALRRTETTYETGSSWIDRNLLSLPKSVSTIVAGDVVSKTLYEYDGNSLAYYSDPNRIDPATYDQSYDPGSGSYQVWVCRCDGEISESPDSCPGGGYPTCGWETRYYYDPSTGYRGNVTKISRMLDTSSGIPSTTRDDITDIHYDMAGNVVSSTVSCCNVKAISYDKANEYAFPVSETMGQSPTQLITSATYNRNTGLVLTTTDANNRVTNYEYESDTLRPKKTIFPNGGYVQTEYSDKLVTVTADLLPGFVRRTTTLESNKFAQSYGYFNGRGDGIRSAAQTPDGWLISASEFDGLGRVRKSYNPFYGSTPVAAIPGGTKYTEITAIDALGRTTGVKLQDDTTVSTAYSVGTDIPSGFNKTFVTVTDQALKKRRQVMDAFGRIVRVDEPDASGSLGAVDASLPLQQTYYGYDGNDNLTNVTQTDNTTTPVTTQERVFKYDSLSRLTHEKQVEATATLNSDGQKVTTGGIWTKVLKYDPHGLLTDGYDARGVRTQLSYDGLNRISDVTYSGESGYQTPPVTYTYDQARTGFYNNGALTMVETPAVGNALATKTEFDYDAMGRVKKHRQWVTGQEYDLEYTYNLAGQLTSETYPSGRIVANSFDANGRLAGIADASRTYLGGLQYQGNGGSLSSMTFGNGTTQTMTLNDRLQFSQQELKRGSETLEKYVYNYGQIDVNNGSITANSNNGELAKVESWIGSTKQWEQRFGYDQLGRLSESREYKQGDNNHLTYKQRFDFDRFGNMYRKAANNGTAGQENPLPYTPIEDSHISKSTNRLTSSTAYDEAGNVVTDNKFRNLNFGYDANGRMVKAVSSLLMTSSGDALSVYDAAGMRVAEKANDVWRFLIYDLGGKMVAEYGGVQMTDEGGVKYLLSDWQGSTRALISNAGYVLGRNDYTTFGEEIVSGVGLRTTTQGFGSNLNPRQKYGLTERDEATGLDHTWWRKHENRGGRWTGPDPYNASMSVVDPQRFNRYSYVANQPTNYIDPSGLLYIVCITRTTYEWHNTPNGPVGTLHEETECHAMGGWGGEPATWVWPAGGDPGGGGSGPDSNPPATPVDQPKTDDKFELCLRSRMRSLREKLNSLMNDHVMVWGGATAVGALISLPAGLAMGGVALAFWLKQFNDFKRDEYDPALAKAKADCKKEVG